MVFKKYISNLPAYKPAKLTRQQPAGVVKLSSNENPLGASPKAVAAIQAAATNIYRYPDAGAAALRASLADHFNLSPEMVICSNGSDELVFLLCVAFLREGDEAVMADGTFVSYAMRTMEVGGIPVRIPLRDYRHDLPAMVDAITDRTRLFFICNPNNPTGTTNTAEEVSAALARIPEHVVVVMDEAYAEFVTRDDYPDTLVEVRAGRPNIITLRTFAKIYGLAGLRLGYAFGSPELITYLDRARPTFNVNMLSQIGGLAALEDSEHLDRSRAHTRASQEFFLRELRKLGLAPVPSETNFIAVPVGDDMAVTTALLDRGFTVTPLSGWGVANHIRISVGLEEENQRFIAALGEILAEQQASDHAAS